MWNVYTISYWLHCSGHSKSRFLTAGLSFPDLKTDRDAGEAVERQRHRDQRLHGQAQRPGEPPSRGGTSLGSECLGLFFTKLCWAFFPGSDQPQSLLLKNFTRRVIIEPSNISPATQTSLPEVSDVSSRKGSKYFLPNLSLLTPWAYWACFAQGSTIRHPLFSFATYRDAPPWGTWKSALHSLRKVGIDRWRRNKLSTHQDLNPRPGDYAAWALPLCYNRVPASTYFSF